MQNGRLLTFTSLSLLLSLLLGCQHHNKPEGAGEGKTVTVPAVATTQPSHAITIYSIPDEGDNDEVETEAGAMAAAGSDIYIGSERKAAKLSIADAPVEQFTDLKNLMATLPSMATMQNHVPPIRTDKTSDRVNEEKR